jgi:amino acid adenylation domain-containing protein
MSSIQERIAALSPEQRKLLELRLKQKQINSITPRKASDTLALSPMQEGLWLAHQLKPDLPLYNESSLFKLTGELDVKALEKSINKIIDRHEILRTSFQVIEDKVTQVVAKELNISLRAIAVTESSETKREAEVKSLVNYYSRQPFNLEQLPLLRSIIITLSEREHLMLVTMHHLISDGWSWGIFCQELAAFYRGLTLPDLKIQYGDFALWYQENIREKITSQLDYWQQQLKDAPPILELPTDYLRPVKQSFKGKRETLIIQTQLTKQLKALSKQENVTTFMLLLAAWKTFLYRYSQQTDILIGTPVANRDRTETENLIGCFINTLVLRSNLDDEPSFLELLQRVKSTTLAAYQHQDVPCEELVKQLNIERAPGINPLFQVMFVYQEAPLLSFDLPDLTITPLPIDNGIAKFDLTLYLEDTKEELIGFLEYSSDLFAENTIKRMLASFQTLLTGILANPDTKISYLPLLTEAETNKLLVEWNNTQKDYRLDICLHQLFEKQVTKTPDAIAVVFEEKSLTYAELNYQANRLAHYLQQLGVGKDILVGICLDRSLEMVVGLLAILKAGGAYVPIDPSYPSERIEFILQDADLKIILTQQHLRETLSSHSAQVICLDTEWEKGIKNLSSSFSESQSNLINNSTPDSLAYVIYTSGSTGTPKGAMNTHRGICNRLLWMQETYQLTPDDAVLQKTPFSFDVSVWEFFWTLITGARLVIAKPGGHQDSIYLVKAIAQHNITTIHFVPSMLQVFLEESELDNLSSLKRVICSGEALSVALQEKFFAKLNAELHNLYGPTEAAIDVTYWQCQPDTNLNTVPIGRPIANTQIYILDKHLQPLPIGVPGELYIGGVGVAKGYLNRPELTKEKFINNPFLEIKSNNRTSSTPFTSLLPYSPTPLLYKTGDLARYLLNGNIEYIGRIDNQVKLRGFRIELGEIETVLTKHPGVREAVVIVKNEPQSLIAYLVLQQPETSITELRCFLQQQLPEYMIPNAFVVLDALPLTTNGKVNRRALSNIDAVIDTKSDYIAPDTPIREILTVIWAKILKLDRVSIEDNFFELGGHSLLATQVISQVRKTFKVEIPLGEFFAAPTIDQFSLLIEKAIASKANLDYLPLKPVTRNSNLPLSFAQQRLWLLQQLEPDSAAYNGSNALLINGNINLEALTASINEIIRRHEILRTSFELINGQAVQKIADELKIVLPIIDLHNLAETEQQAEIKRLTEIDAQKPFDLTQAPLLRLTLIKLKTEKHFLLVTMHHIISDAWSAGIFIKEISALYQAFSTGKPSPLPELSIQYADFAVWQQEWLQGEVLNNQLTYWKKQLENAKTTLELPIDKFSNEITSVGKQYHFSLDRELSQNLETLCQQQRVTLFMTLLTIFNTLLYSYSQQEDILIGSPIANRNRSEIEGLIGFFVNTLVLRTDLSNNPTFTELLQKVREIALDAYAYQDLPFDKLVAELQPERYRDRSPLFQVWFVLQNAPTAEFQISGLNLTLLDIETGLVRHDLKLDLTKTESGIQGFFEYKQDLFSENAIANLIWRFKTITNLVIQQPELKLDELIKVVIDAEKEKQKNKSDRFKQQQIQQLNKFKRKAVNRE